MIYRYKATLPNHKTFVRVYEVRANATLYALHLFLQDDLSFSPDQQVLFCSVDNMGKPADRYGLFDMGNGSMDQVRLEELHQKGVRIIRYVFDTFKGRYLALEFEGMDGELARKHYPRTIMEKGGDPDQFQEEHSSLDVQIEEFDSE